MQYLSAILPFLLLEEFIYTFKPTKITESMDFYEHMLGPQNQISHFSKLRIYVFLKTI